VVKFTLETSGQVNLVRAYSEREIIIGERHLTRSCILTATQLLDDWAPAEFAALDETHLETIFALEPELVLLGTGPVQRFASAPVRAAFAQRRVGLEVMQLGAACRTFNVLVQEERRVAAALFLR
jgi:uncharacterized protein